MAKKPIIRYFDRGVWYDATVSDIGNLEELNTIFKAIRKVDSVYEVKRKKV